MRQRENLISEQKKQEMLPGQELQYASLGSVVYGALSTYASGLDEVLSEPRINEIKLRQITQNFQRTTRRIEALNFPASVINPLSFEFIDYSINNPHNVHPQVRFAAADMGTALGGNTTRTAKVRHIAEYYVDTVNDQRKKGSSSDHKFREELAEHMLRNLDVTVDVATIPSLIEDMTMYAKAHARTAATTGVAALVAASILSPNAMNAASANEATPAIQLSPQTNTSVAEMASSVIVSVPETSGVAMAINLGDSSEKSSSFIDAVVAMPESAPEGTPVEAGIIHIGEAVDEISTVVAAPVIDVIVNPVSDVPVESLVLGGAEAAAPDQEVVTVVSPPEAAPLPEASDDGSTDTDVTPEPITLAPEPVPEPELNPDEAITPTTPEQEVTQSIVDTLNSGGDIDAAVSILLQNYGVEGAGTTENVALATKIQTLREKFVETMQSGGHADVTYVNSTLMAVSLLKAVAYDPTILDSEDVKELLKVVEKPSDKYGVELFDQYLGLTDAILEGDDGTLMTGIDGSYKDKIQTLYAHVLMASSSDADIAEQINGLKEADEKEAAEKAAKAAEEARDNQGGEHSKIHGHTSEKALNRLIRRSDNERERNGYLVMKYSMEKGFSDEEAAAIVGNAAEESNLDPGKIQNDGKGPGAYLFQWEEGRRIKYEAYAAEHGKPVDDIKTQIDFLWLEMHGDRSWAFQPLLNADDHKEATFVFFKLFETPDVIIHGTKAEINKEWHQRIDAGRPFLDRYNRETKKIKEQAKSVDNVIDRLVTDGRGNSLTKKSAGSGYVWGNCTYWVAAVMNELNTPLPARLGNAIDWDNRAKAAGVRVDNKPEVGAVWQTGTLTSPSNPYGHVAVVVEVYKDGGFRVKEMNHEGLNVVNGRDFPASAIKQSKFIHPQKKW